MLYLFILSFWCSLLAPQQQEHPCRGPPELVRDVYPADTGCPPVFQGDASGGPF